MAVIPAARLWQCPDESGGTVYEHQHPAGANQYGVAPCGYAATGKGRRDRGFRLFPSDALVSGLEQCRAKAEHAQHSIDCVFVDEAQFLSKRQVWQLCAVVDELEIPVICYGLRTDFRGEPFEGSQYLLAWAEELNVPHNGWEIQMLYGMAEEQAQLFSERGHRVRVYTPFGELIPGMAYLVRRLLENTSNDSFLRHAYDTDVSVEDLLQRPADAALSKAS